MVSYRSRLDIISDILQVASENAKKTQIMYRANLNYKVLIKYLKKASEVSLIDYKCEKQCYMITPKGEEFLEAYKEYSRDIKNLKKQRKEINAKKNVLEELCSNK